ncbi:hypothetical protein [Alteribacter natronophilus]|uniref:hypothetical protein n=1 Tax=Alteribacter natronophilus TaxID=2583810 RepID=UPI00110E3ED3|nr:hypothetical protein [Alteribacter natronophilus]TMW70346.1 hypothetical protein FGB90_16865 [Alteribacter natronophilus]
MRGSGIPAAVCLFSAAAVWVVTFTAPAVTLPFTAVPLWIVNLILTPAGLIFSGITLNRNVKQGLPLMIGNLVLFPGIMIFILSLIEALNSSF